MKGSIHVCKVKEKLDRTSLCLDEVDVSKLNAPMIVSS